MHFRQLVVGNFRHHSQKQVYTVRDEGDDRERLRIQSTATLQFEVIAPIRLYLADEKTRRVISGGGGRWNARTRPVNYIDYTIEGKTNRVIERGVFV